MLIGACTPMVGPIHPPPLRFNENARVLAWILKRCDGSVDAEHSPIGLLPKAGDIDLAGMDGFVQ